MQNLGRQSWGHASAIDIKIQEGVTRANLDLYTQRGCGDGLSTVFPKVERPIYSDYLSFGSLSGELAMAWELLINK